MLLKPVGITDLYHVLTLHLEYSVISPDKILDQVVSIGDITDLPGLLDLLHSSLREEWIRLSKNYPINGIKDFGMQLSEVGRKHNAESVIKYGQNMIEAAENFEIDKILLLTNQFTRVTEELRSQSNHILNE